MVYVGIVAQVLRIELDELKGALDTHFRGKSKPVELNMKVIEAAAEWAENNLTKADPFFVRRSNEAENKIMMEGNMAAALGAIYGGVTFAAWYPITPASSLADNLTAFLPRLRRDEDSGKRTYTVIQAEDEISAIGMAIGAGWAGARAMTSTSGPGISLMAEFAGLAYFAEIPLVIWDVQRMGPSTGLPTRTSQGDLIFSRFLGHGDTEQVVLLPGSISECFEFGWRAFDYAEKFQTPIFVLSDLDLGMNLWISDPFDYPEDEMDRGKVLTAEDLERIGEFARYRDVDGDGIPYRTLPGTDHPSAAYFTRGTGHTEHAAYSESPQDWVENFERLMRKHANAKEQLPLPVIQKHQRAEVGLIGFGSTDSAILEAIDRLSSHGTNVDYMRVRALPFSKTVAEFIQSHERNYVIEMNSSGQLHKLLVLEVPEQAGKLNSLTHNDGLPITAKWLTDAILEVEGG
jgi:2-oxoglutarate ferredoxin oxidoreductase subunit alpha